MTPFNQMQDWIEREKKLGSEYPNRIVLATISPDGLPRSRIVAIHEITDDSLLFFTQRGSRKVQDLQRNSQVSLTLWLPLQQRQVVLEGSTNPLTPSENEYYWQTLPKEKQLRFWTFGPISGHLIESSEVLEKRLKTLTQQYDHHQALPHSPFYCGYRVKANSLLFYTLGNEKFSEILHYTCNQTQWVQQLRSP